MKKINKKGGFTLIEILVVIGIIAILAAIVIIAINPAKQFAQARNTQRVANINAILNAVGQRIADNKGIFYGSFTINGDTYVCDKLSSNTDFDDYEPVLTTPATATDDDDEPGELGCLVPTYIPALPTDPAGVTSPDTGYTINVNSTGRISVCAPEMLNEDALPTITEEEACVTR